MLCVCPWPKDFHLVIAKLTRKRRRQNRYRLSLWITRFFGQPEDRAHDTLPVPIVRDRKSKGIWSHPVPSKGVTHPYPARALMADLDFMGYRRVILKSDQEPSIVALCDAVKLLHMVGTARHVPGQANNLSQSGESKCHATETLSNVLFSAYVQLCA